VKPLTDKQIIGGIRKKDHTVLTWVYQTQFSRVEKFVLKYGGHREDAEDIFQEALVSIFRSATKGKIEFEVGFPLIYFQYAEIYGGRYTVINILLQKRQLMTCLRFLIPRLKIRIRK